MELVYIWIDEFRNFEEVGVSLTDKFIIEYTKETGALSIEKNEDFYSIYPEHITAINAIVGIKL